MQPLLVLPGIFMIGSSYSEIFTSSEINSTSPYLFLQGTRALTNSTKFLGSSYLQDPNDDPFYEIRERANPRAMLPLSKDLLRSQANGFGMPLVNCVAENGDIYGQYSWIRYSKAFQEIKSKPPIEPTKRVVDCWSDGDVLKLLEREDNETHSFFIAENEVDKKLGTVNGLYLTMIRTVNSPSKILVIGGIDKNQQKKLFWANTSTAAPTLNALVESFPPTAKEIGFVERTNTLYFACNGLSKSDELHSTCFFSIKFHDGTATVQSYPQIDALLGLYNPNQRAAWVPAQKEKWFKLGVWPRTQTLTELSANILFSRTPEPLKKTLADLDPFSVVYVSDR